MDNGIRKSKNENFMEIGTGINVLDKLMEIIVGLGVNTKTTVTYEQIGGKKEEMELVIV